MTKKFLIIEHETDPECDSFAYTVDEDQLKYLIKQWKHQDRTFLTLEDLDNECNLAMQDVGDYVIIIEGAKTAKDYPVKRKVKKRK